MKTSDRSLMIVRPLCELYVQDTRLEMILGPILGDLEERGIQVELIEKVSELEELDLRNRRIIIAVNLSEAGVNLEYYRFLEFLRAHPNCLEGSVGGIIVDGRSDLFTKALARRVAFSANMAGCTFPGKPLVEATGTLANFKVLSKVMNLEPHEVYEVQVRSLIRKVLDFKIPSHDGPLNIAVVHASSRKTSNTLLLWEKVKNSIIEQSDIPPIINEISLRNGDMLDCRGCKYEDCLHFGENGGCFYGGIMVEKVFPAIIDCDVLVMICPNYNDAVSANLTAFINRLTAIFRTHDFTSKRIYSLVISGYSGGDIVSEQIIGAINFNKNFILPGHFAMVETANDPKSILDVEDIDAKARCFASRIVGKDKD